MSDDVTTTQPTTTQPTTAIPTAVIRRERRVSAAWIVPVLALLLAAWLGVAAWRQRGVRITVQFPDGHGLKIGDPVRFRGIAVGDVREIVIGEQLEDVVVTIALHEEADRLARAGSRFWIARPRFRLTRVEGLETLVGPRYVEIEPGAATAQPLRAYVGLAEPPVIRERAPGDLEIVIEAGRLGSLSPGVPIKYRQVQVGTVLSTGLAIDGGLVEARALIRQPYRSLVHVNTRFWDAGGFKADVRLTGASLQIDSIQELLAGGVALATPPPDHAGPPVHTGHRFPLAPEAEDDWLEWVPVVALGNSLLPAGAVVPAPLRASIGWRQGMIIRGFQFRQGWVLQTDAGLLGPRSLLRPDRRADMETVTLEVGGAVVPLDGPPAWEENGLARLDLRIGTAVWPSSLVRRAEAPEDCLALADPAGGPLPLAASRLVADGRTWNVDPAVSIDPAWHGASVLARSDGRMVGMLLVEDGTARVALLDPPAG